MHPSPAPTDTPGERILDTRVWRGRRGDEGIGGRGSREGGEVEEGAFAPLLLVSVLRVRDKRLSSSLLRCEGVEG